MSSPEEALQFLQEQCRMGGSANIQMAALPEKGIHPMLVKVAEICGSADIYPGQGNVISIPKQLFLQAREALHILFERSVAAGAQLQTGTHTCSFSTKHT